MSCEHLVCASCAGPVIEGRCAVCRAARAEVHHHHGWFGLPPQVVIAVVAVMLLLAMLLQHAQS